MEDFNGATDLNSHLAQCSVSDHKPNEPALQDTDTVVKEPSPTDALFDQLSQLLEAKKKAKGIKYLQSKLKEIEETYPDTRNPDLYCSDVVCKFAAKDQEFSAADARALLTEFEQPTEPIWIITLRSACEIFRCYKKSIGNAQTKVWLRWFFNLYSMEEAGSLTFRHVAILTHQLLDKILIERPEITARESLTQRIDYAIIVCGLRRFKEIGIADIFMENVKQSAAAPNPWRANRITREALKKSLEIVAEREERGEKMPSGLRSLLTMMMTNNAT